MSICTIAADFSVAAIVEAMLPCGGSLPEGISWVPMETPRRALYIRLRVECNQHLPNEEIDIECRWVHLIFERPTSYTKVFCFVSDRHIGSHQLNPAAFVMESDHDSCWRVDGLREIDRAWFAIRNLLDERHGQPKPPSRRSWFSIIDAIEWLTITMAKVPDEETGHFKSLTSIEREES